MANISHYLKKALPAGFKDGSKPDYYLIAAIILVVSIPAGYAVSNAALGIFAITAWAGIKKQNIKLSFALFLPVALFALMCISLLWSIDITHSAKSVSKNLPLLIIPVCLMLNPLAHGKEKIILKYYSLAMVGYALYYVLRGFWRYVQSSDINVFFYHELTTNDVNAIHVSLYMALALFYYIALPAKAVTHYITIIFLAVIIVLLSSKSLIITTFALAGIYFMFFSCYRVKVKVGIAVTGIFMLTAVIALVPKIRERFIIETSTLFKENTVNAQISVANAKVYNVSLNEALNTARFNQNDYFPGTAFRAFQARIFIEMATEDDAWLTGYGLNASQEKIREKVTMYNLHPGYGEFNFHNQYIQNLAELGIAGLLILLVILFINAKNAFSRKDFVHISLAILLITLFLTESLLARQRGIIFFVAFYCFFNAAESYANHQKSSL